MNDPAARPRMSAEVEVYQGQHQAQEGNDQGNYLPGQLELSIGEFVEYYNNQRLA